MHGQKTDENQDVVSGVNGFMEQWSSLVSQQEEILSQLLEECTQLRSKLAASEADNRRMKALINTLVSFHCQGNLDEESKVKLEGLETIPTIISMATLSPKQESSALSEKSSPPTIIEDDTGFQLVGKNGRTQSPPWKSAKGRISATKEASYLTSNEQATSNTRTSDKGTKDSRRPCNVHYLLGQCFYADCPYEHGYDRADVDIEHMKLVAKKQPCKYANENKGCWIDNCIYGHKCPQGKQCKYFAFKKCKFIGENMHHEDE